MRKCITSITEEGSHVYRMTDGCQSPMETLRVTFLRLFHCTGQGSQPQVRNKPGICRYLCSHNSLPFSCFIHTRWPEIRETLAYAREACMQNIKELLMHCREKKGRGGGDDDKCFRARCAGAFITDVFSFSHGCCLYTSTSFRVTELLETLESLSPDW